jgi:co-chaperonin GroES (HSP10)
MQITSVRTLTTADRDDGRMYGILDDKFVTKHSDGSVTAMTKGNRIDIANDGSFKIMTKDGSKTLFEKASGTTAKKN